MYQPLTPEQLAAEHAKQPRQDQLITPESLMSEVVSVTFSDVTGPDDTTRCIVCLLTLENGYQALGKAFVVDPENFNRKLGEHYSYNDALSQLYSVRSYVMKEHAYQMERTGLGEL